jgi:hypothetical protein
MAQQLLLLLPAPSRAASARPSSCNALDPSPSTMILRPMEELLLSTNGAQISSDNHGDYPIPANDAICRVG